MTEESRIDRACQEIVIAEADFTIAIKDAKTQGDVLAIAARLQGRIAELQAIENSAFQKADALSGRRVA